MHIKSVKDVLRGIPGNLSKSMIPAFILIISFVGGIYFNSIRNKISEANQDINSQDETQISKNTQIVDENPTRITSFGYAKDSFAVNIEAYLSKPGFIILNKSESGSNTVSTVERTSLLEGNTGKITLNNENQLKPNDTVYITIFRDDGDQVYTGKDEVVISNFLILK